MTGLRPAFVLAGVLCAAALWAVPSFTPTIDGVKDAAWGNTPDHSTTTQRLPTEFNLDGGIYVTDDNTSLYFGFDADHDPWADGKSVHVHIVLDIGSTAAGGTFACWGANNVLYGFPFKPEYDIVLQWYTDNQAVGFTGLNNWTGSGWGQTELTSDAGGGGSWTELAIPKPLIGLNNAGTPLNVSMWLRPAWDTPGGVACLPADENFPSDYGAAAGTFSSQWIYTTQAAFGESDPPGIAQVRQIDRDEVEIVFDEPMNAATLAVLANYTPTGWSIHSVSYTTATTVGLRCNFDFAEGSTYAVTVGPGVTDVAGNPMDPNDDDAAWTAVDYANVIVVVAAPAAYSCIRFKGSFNFYHEFDSFWSGGSHQMWDDGTHGDSVANDNRHTLVWPLVPHPEGPYEWGAETCDGNWIIQGPNRQVLVDNGGVFYTSYQVPDPTNAPVAITFRCDMQFIGDPFTGVAVAGSFNGWPGPGEAMSDPDNDGQWTVVYTLPAGSPRQQEFKFQRIDGANVNWEGVNNRTFDIVGSPSTLDLGNMFFDNYLAAPQDVTAYQATPNTNVTLRWNPYSRVSFEIFGHTAPDSVMENGTLLGSSPANSFTTPATDLRKFYQVRTVAP